MLKLWVGEEREMVLICTFCVVYKGKENSGGDVKNKLYKL